MNKEKAYPDPDAWACPFPSSTPDVGGANSVSQKSEQECRQDKVRVV